MKNFATLIALLLVPVSLPAVANPFGACKGAEQRQFLHENEYVAFAKAFKKNFDQLAALSKEEIAANKSCLSGAASKINDCSDRVQYFQKTLPIEWKKYRKSYALSGWNKHYLVTKDRSEELLDMNPNGAALDEKEREDVQTTFKKETDLIFRKTLQELETAEKRSKEISASNLQGRQLLTMKDWSYIHRSNNYWAVKVVSRVEHLVFQLNQKRMLQQRLNHPILAYLNEKDLNNGALFAAMDRMNVNLAAEETFVSGIVTQVTTGSSWSLDTLFPLIDYLSVTETTLSEDSNLCSAADKIYSGYRNHEVFKQVAMLTAGVGLMIFAPVGIAVGGIASIQLYSIYESSAHFDLVSRGSLTNPDPSIAMKSGEDSYMAKENVNTEIMMSPFVMVGMTTLRYAKLLLVFI